MSMSSERMMKLMAYADGELDGTEKVEVEKLVESNEEAARIVNAMLGLGDFVREGNQQKVAPLIAKVDLTDAIMKKVEKAEIEPAKPASNVSSLDAARAKKRNVGVGIVAALALAASIFFVMQNKPDEKPMAAKPVPAPTQTAPAPQQMASNELPAVNASTSAGVEVQAFESPGHSVSVFYLPTANELSTSVTVWVDEEKK
jgi:anti-sigma factor RsiW